MSENQLIDQINTDMNGNALDIYVGQYKLIKQIPAHKHFKSQLLIVEKGIAYLKTDSCYYYIPSRHYIWIPRDISHEIEFKAAEFIIKTIYFPDENDRKHSFFGNVGIYSMPSLIREMANFTNGWTGVIEKKDWRHEYLLALKHLLPHANSKPMQLTLPSTTHVRLLGVLNYLDAHFSENSTITTIAGKFGFSVRNFSRIFFTELNITYVHYIKTLRVIKAMEMLLTKDKNVSEVAYLAGYSSVAAFCTSFVQIVHKRPKEFQQLN